MQTLQTQLPVAFNQIRQGATFLSIKNYLDNHGGRSNFGIVFHIDYLKAVKKSVNIWYNYTPQNNLEKEIRQDLINSYEETLAGNNTRARSAHAYTQISDGQEIIKGVKWHQRNQEIHLYGFVVHKVVLTEANYPADKRSLREVTRKRLRKLTPLDKFRQYKLVPGRFDSVGVENLTLTQQDLIQDIK